jgi:hypothetical protein
VLLALLVQHLLQVGAVLDELIGLEIAGPAPPLLERIDLRHREIGGPARQDPVRQLLLIGNEILVPDDRRGRRLILLEEHLLARRCELRHRRSPSSPARTPW